MLTRENYKTILILKFRILSLFVLTILCSSLSAQRVHFSKTYSILDGLSYRSQRNILCDTEGKIWLVSDLNFQLFTGKDFLNIDFDINVDLDEIDKIESLDNHKIVLLGKKASYVINTKNKNIKPFPQTPDNPNYIIDGEIIELNSILNKYKSLVDTVTWKYLDIIDDQLIGLSDNQNLTVSSTQNSTILHDSVSMVLGSVQDSLFYIRNNKVWKLVQGKHIMSTKMKGSTGLLKKDEKGQSLLGLSFDTRRIQQFYLFSEEGKEDYSFIQEKTNTIRDFYSPNFKEEILLATYNGLIYQNYSEYIYKNLWNSDLEEGKFGDIVWWIIHRTKTDEVYFAKEGIGIYKYEKDSVTTVFPNKKHPQAFRANYYGYYDKKHDLLFASSFGSGGNDLWIWDFGDELIKQKTDIRISNFLSLNDQHIFLTGHLNKVAVVALFDLEKKEIIKTKLLPALGKNIYTATLSKDGIHLSAYSGFYKLNFDDTDSLDLENPVVDTIHNYSTLDHKELNGYTISGTYGDGVSINKKDSLIKRYTVENGLIDNIVLTVGIDEEKYIWLATLKGISVLDSNFHLIKNIRKVDGLSSSDLNSHSFATTSDHVYLGSINGINRISKNIVKSRKKHSLLLTSLEYEINGLNFTTEYNDLKKVEIPFHVDSCTLNFQPYSIHQSFLSKDYLLRNTLKDAKGNFISKVDQTIKIPISKEQTLIQQSLGYEDQKIEIGKQTFINRYGLLLALATIFLLLVILLRSYIKRRKAIKDREVNVLKYNLINMRSTALRSQMNPHFIFNALGAIQYHIQKEDTELAEEYLSDFAFLMRRILESSRKDFVKLSEEIEMLKLYIKLEHLRFDQKFEYQFNVSKDLNMMDEVPSMIIQPYIENAINHGIYHLKNKKGKLILHLSESINGGIICTIQDNGVGRAASKKWNTKKHKSRGAEITKERLEILSKTHNQQFKVDIVDLGTIDNPRGTKITVSFNT